MRRYLLLTIAVLSSLSEGFCDGEQTPPAEMTLLRCGAIYRDDFSAGSPSSAPWRIWPAPKGKNAFVRFSDGEFQASGGGIVWGRTSDGDCAVAADVGHEPGTAPYGYQQVHLCAGAGGSADYSVQAFLTTDRKRMVCVSEYHTEVGTEGVTTGYLRDPQSPSQGASWPNDGRLRTVLVQRNAETQLGTVYARLDDGWAQCGRSRRFPFGGLGVELKTYAGSLDSQSAVARWDNFRIYPRPGSHNVCLRVVSSAGQLIKEPGLSVQLLDAAGKQLVSQARLYQGLCLLSLRNTPWLSYPVSGRVRLVRDDSLCAEGVISADGVEGLFPADVWEMKVAWPPTRTLPLSKVTPAKRPQPRRFQSPKDRPPADLSFLKKRPLPSFSKIVRVRPPASPDEKATFLADDFAAGSLDLKRWKTNTGQAEVVQGALRLRGSTLVSASLGDHTDTIAVCEVQLEGAVSTAAVRLVGGPLGPPYSAGVVISGDGQVAFEYLTEPGTEGMELDPKPIADSPAKTVKPASGGLFTVKIERADSTGQARCFVKGADNWRQVGRWRTIPMRDVKLVLESRTGTATFDAVRAYPRPEVKYVYFRVRANLSQQERAQYQGDPLHREIVVELYNEEGNRLVGRARGYHGSTHVPLAPDAWDTYPAAAIVKVFYLDKQVGEPQKLDPKGLDGLYPGSVWQIAIE